MSTPLIERRLFAMHGRISLRRWRLQNFKSVRNAEVELRPLTVIVGANSAGKSTLLQSIRVASQATGSTGYLYPLNGRGVRLGTVAEVRYRGPGSDDEPLIIGADFEIQVPGRVYMRGRPLAGMEAEPVLGTLSWEVVLGESVQRKGTAKIERLNVDLKPEEAAPLPKAAPHLDRTWLLAIADDDAEDLVPVDEDEEAVSIPHYFTGKFSGANGSLFEVADILVTGGFPQDASVMRPRAEVLFETWRDMVPRRSIHERDQIKRGLATVANEMEEEVTRDLLAVHAAATKAKTEYADAVRFELGSKTAEARFKMDLNVAYSETFGDAIIEELTKGGVDGDVPFPHRLDDLGPASSLASSFLGARIRYLGPLREEPRAAYLDSPEGDDSYVGSKGEFTASVLQRHGDRKVSVPTPDGGLTKTPRRQIRLMTAVSRWAKFLDIGESFSVSDQGRFGIQMHVRQADVEGDLDLTSVGTGVSQLLPVIVMCVQAPVGSLLLIEQPELHLNPKVQQRLADFLLAIAQSGRHLVVETHSEYLISRLRRRVAEDEKDSLQDTIGIYFAKRVDGATTYDRVQPNEYGGIEKWPENFFDQATEEEHAILSAAVKKRRAKAAQSD